MLYGNESAGRRWGVSKVVWVVVVENLVVVENIMEGGRIKGKELSLLEEDEVVLEKT
jgi:hypothetical protein